MNPSMVRAADSDLQKTPITVLPKAMDGGCYCVLAQDVETGSKPGVDFVCRAIQELLYLCTMFIC